MKIVGSSFLKLVVVVILAIPPITYVFSKQTSRQDQPATVATREFNHPEDADKPWVGPAIGERIDLVHLRDERGISLSEVISDGLSMLVLVDPGCWAPKAASDQLRIVYDGVSTVGLRYYVISVTSSVPSSDFIAYARSIISSGSSVFLWEKGVTVTSQKLYSMVLPSHVLIDNHGVIIRKWPGTSVSEEVRYRMANEIIADTITELASRKRAIQRLKQWNSFNLGIGRMLNNPPSLVSDDTLREDLARLNPEQ
jgi:hypothetical protein